MFQVSEEERQKKKKEAEIVKKMAEKEKQMKLRFREKAEEKINSFLRNGDLKTYKFPPMHKFQRKSNYS